MNAIETILSSGSVSCYLLPATSQRVRKYQRTPYERMKMSKSQRAKGLRWEALVSQLSVWTLSVLGTR